MVVNFFVEPFPEEITTINESWESWLNQEIDNNYHLAVYKCFDNDDKVKNSAALSIKIYLF